MLLGEIVIGSTVESAYYALINDHYFIPTRQAPLMFYEKLNTSLFGSRHRDHAWNKLNLILGLMSRRIPLGEGSSLKISEDQIRMVSDNVMFKYSFEKVYIFDPTGLGLENEIKQARQKTHIVFDDFELSVLGPKRYELDPITGGDGFARELHFYCSDRVDGANFITDCVVESELTQEQLNSFDYSDSVTRFVVLRHLDSIGVLGRLMKHYDSGKPKYRKPKVTHVRRLVFERDNNEYVDSRKIKFMNMSLEEMIEISTKR